MSYSKSSKREREPLEYEQEQNTKEASTKRRRRRREERSMSSDAVRVVVRVRPVSRTTPVAWRVSSSNTIAAVESADADAASVIFSVDDVVASRESTRGLYDRAVADLARDVTKGINATVFAYGQTSSGKTYTMRGGEASEPGVMCLAVQDVFDAVEADISREYLIRCSYMEIYNEEIKDLLCPMSGRLQVHEAVDRGVYVAGLTEEVVSSAGHVMEILDRGERERHVGSTNMNARSSRSHSLFRMVVESRELDDVDAVKVSTLMLVDLAGSERLNKTGAAGARAREGAFINKSLLTLSNVITKLSEVGQMDEHAAQHVHVPYRESKLTRILQPSLGGNARTAVICAVNPSREHYDETVGTLRFATRCGKVRNAAVVNEVVNEAALLCRQKREIESLRQQLEARGDAALSNLDDEVRALRNALLEKDQANERIWMQLEEEKAAKEVQRRQIDSLTTLVMNTRPNGAGEADGGAPPLRMQKRGSRRETWCPGVDGNAMDRLLPIRDASPALATVRSGTIAVTTPTSSERGGSVVAADDTTSTTTMTTTTPAMEIGSQVTTPASDAIVPIIDDRSTASVMRDVNASEIAATSETCEQQDDIKDDEAVVLHIHIHEEAPPPAPVIALNINVIDETPPPPVIALSINVVEDSSVHGPSMDSDEQPHVAMPLVTSDAADLVKEVYKVSDPVQLTLNVVEQVTVIEPPRIAMHIAVVDNAEEDDASAKEEPCTQSAGPLLDRALVEELERDRARIDELVAEKTALSQQCDASTLKLADMESERALLQARIEETQATCTTMQEQHDAEVLRLREELKSRNRQLHKMMEVYGKLKKKHVRSGGDGAEMDRVRDAKSLEFELDYANTKRRQMREQVDSLNRDKGRLEDENRILREQAANSRMIAD